METMKRREWIERSTALGVVAATPAWVVGGPTPRPDGPGSAEEKPRVEAPRLRPPAAGRIPVAVLLSEGAVVIDFCGPWAVFQDASVPGNDGFDLYTVAESTAPIRASGGMRIVPDYTFETAPAPKVLVIPAQSAPDEATLEWIRRATNNTDVTMSVCTGAFVLAKTGLLSGKAATTHHASYRAFAMQFPDIQLKRGARFVEEGNLATAGGLSSGIDLALHVVERYYGREVAEETAYTMEYQGQGWKNADSNEVYAKERKSSEAHPLCPVCDMEVDPRLAVSSVYRGKAYYLCSADHKRQFEAAPEKFTNAGSADRSGIHDPGPKARQA
jgi:putative intracellular protease/amidase/YHS domain-containing protein